MSQPLLLVDFENVQTIDVQHIPPDYQIAIFCGANQKSASLDLTTRLQNLGSQVQWHRVSGTGKNALDFHIAFHIGRVLERKEASEFIILAKDTGYDPLVKHIGSLGVSCKRVAVVGEIHRTPAAPTVSSPKPAPKASSPPSAELERVKANLTKVLKNKRPRKRATLTKHVSTLFGNKLTKAQLTGLVDDMFRRKMISEANNAISYHF
ncbi:PIN domain-containing protein [Cupriavidus sp. 2TAF22]|uniref:PIN domain-containing protein n=1 Tax=unclassified Cupriavidus TaxID=2640874 RepID=UPI003F91A95E